MEVLSEATERLDREEKFRAYRQLDSLQEYLSVPQDRRLVELLRREDDWRPEYFGEGERAVLRSVGLELAVASVYEDLG